MYVEIRKEGKNLKYYLCHSHREGSKSFKDRKYLGMNLTPEKLELRKKIAEKLMLEEMHKYTIINNPLIFELSDEEISEIKKLQLQIPLKIEHLSKEQWTEFTKIFTYNTNAIEGSKLKFAEVRDILEKDLWPDKSKEDIAEAYGVEEAIVFIRNTKEHLSLDLIKKIHRIVFKNSKSFAGKFRKKGEEVVVMDEQGRVVHEGAPQNRVVSLLNQLVEWYEVNKTKYPALVLAGVVHNQFENIHPFRDGNGRVGRILLNNILIKHGLPPVNIDLRNRFEYYSTLQEFEKNQNLKPTIELFMKEYKDMVKIFGSK